MQAPINDLDQLFKQAEGVYPLLRAKVSCSVILSAAVLLAPSSFILVLFHASVAGSHLL